jgi:REP element-mobilizing transposase RayT
MTHRNRPARESAIPPKFTECIFITCCTRRRTRVLDNKEAHGVLLSLWGDRSRWSITRYVIMPDHIHLMAFASRGSRINLRSWAAWWKAHATRELGFTKGELWLRDLWDTRMRNADHYAAKLVYMKENPARAGLVTSSDLWPYQGDLLSIGGTVVPCHSEPDAPQAS